MSGDVLNFSTQLGAGVLTLSTRVSGSALTLSSNRLSGTFRPQGWGLGLRRVVEIDERFTLHLIAHEISQISI